MDDEPMGRMYKKTKPERGVKQLKKDKSGKSKSKGKNSVKRKGKAKKR